MVESVRIFDADTHYFEPSDLFERYIEPQYRHLAVRSQQTEDGPIVMAGDKVHTYMKDYAWDRTVKPGALGDYIREQSFSTAAAFSEEMDNVVRVEDRWVSDRDARVRLLDEQGVEGCLLFPTLSVTIEHPFRNDPIGTYANLRALNRWLDDVWGFDYQQRLYAVPALSLIDLDMAVKELDWLLERGARMVNLRPGPAFGRSPGDPYFDPFWARLNEAGVPVAFHIGDAGYCEALSSAWGHNPDPETNRMSALQWVSFYGDRPIMDTIAALILDNLFGRFPNLNVYSVENGSLWVPYLMKQLDKMKGMGRNGPWIGGYVSGRPSEVFKRHVFVNPFHEEDIVALAQQIGASQVVFGSDYPHGEGITAISSFAPDHLSSLAPEDVQKIMGGNIRRLLNLEPAVV